MLENSLLVTCWDLSTTRLCLCYLAFIHVLPHTQQKSRFCFWIFSSFMMTSCMVAKSPWATILSKVESWGARVGPEQVAPHTGCKPLLLPLFCYLLFQTYAIYADYFNNALIYFFVSMFTNPRKLRLPVQQDVVIYEPKILHLGLHILRVIILEV